VYRVFLSGGGGEKETTEEKVRKGSMTTAESGMENTVREKRQKFTFSRVTMYLALLLERVSVAKIGLGKT